NLSRVRDMVPASRVCAAVKANGYGHGAVTVARALADADMFAVSSLDEALELRRAGIGQPVVTLSQPLDLDICRCLAENDIRPVVFDQTHLGVLDNHTGPTLKVWILLDSGMHRLGFPADEAADIDARLQSVATVERMGFATHLACADDPEHPLTARQLA